MFQELRASLILLLFFTLLTGLAYPLFIKTIGQTSFPTQAEGSLVEQNGKIIGSSLIGQTFTSDKYFHPRPSAAGNGYDASNSSASNLAPSAPDLVKTISARVAEWRKEGDLRPIPIDLVTASASGLDPDISVAAAQFQAPRIAEIRGFTLQQINVLISANTTKRLFGVFGEPRINVLALNRALDLAQPTTPTAAPTP